MAPNSQTAHTISSFDCDGGGTATMDVTGWSGKWAATFTFDDCTIGASPNVLTVNGTLDYHNGINDDDGGRATGLSISGTIDGCATTIAETCDLSWYSEPKEPGTNYNYYRFGMLCGRQFP